MDDTWKNLYNTEIDAHIAQSEEHVLGKNGVTEEALWAIFIANLGLSSLRFLLKERGLQTNLCPIPSAPPKS